MTIFQNLIAGSGFLQGPTGATGPAANTNITAYEYVATAGQTTFTGVDSNLQTLAYTPTGIFVTLNGSVLNDVVDFTATNGTSVVLTQAASTDDELNIYAFPAFNVANTYTQAQTNSLLDTKLNITGGTITGNVAISSNGYLQVPIGTTAQRPDTTPGFIRYNTDLNSLESANGTAWANVGSGGASSGGGGVAWTPTVQNTSFIAVKNNGYFVNTATGNVTVTLPASPVLGDNITFVDYGGRFSSNGLIFFPNGSRINANTVNVALTTSTASIGLVYTDNNKGWVAYNGFQSSPIGNYNIEYLVIAGGGGGTAGYASGGGGAGGMISATTTILSGVTYSVTVGAGGAGMTGSSGAGWRDASSPSGTNSSIGALVTALGGGGGRCNSASGAPAPSGGSGGGGASSAPGGSGTPGQGNAGGTGSSHGGGGGGGAGGAGSNGSGQSGVSPVIGGNGGAGATNSISGTTTTYGGGGGGGVYVTPGPGGTGGSGGSGGGGAAGANSHSAGAPGTTNLGGGGGSGGGYEPTVLLPGAAGGSGVVIIRYFGPQRASGGAITQTGGYTIHTYTSSGTFVS